MEKREQTRAALSCLECRRRKQKCSREWPCNHCVARKVSHLCTFGNKGSPTNPQATTEIQGQQGQQGQSLKRRKEVDDIDSGVDLDVPGVETLGYLGGLPEYNLESLASEVWLSKKVQPPPPDPSQDVQKAIQSLPSRSLTDALVQNFVNVVNFNYNALYPPTFLEEYTQWWADRAARKPLSPEYTCLLLRACAVSSQNMPAKLRNVLEFELAMDPSLLPERFHQAAEALSSNFTPGEKGLIQVQQLFLVVCWFKSEGRFVDSWHAMARCVREAQEHRLHQDDTKMNISEYEREMRRRMMNIIYVWDWLMSKWLGRPLLIDHSSCSFLEPTLQLENSADEPGLPSPFTNISLQSKLIRTISPSLRDADKNPTEESVEELRKVVRAWTDTLPRMWWFQNPDTSYDQRHPYLAWQRCLLHGTVAIIEMLPTKPYLTGNAVAKDPRTNQYFRSLGVDGCLKSLELAITAYSWMKDLDPKHFYINFILFDILTILCSAVIHDHERNLPRREKVLESIESGLANLKLIAKCSTAGATSYAFVTKLAQCIPLSSAEEARWSFRKTKRMKVSASSTSEQSVSAVHVSSPSTTGSVGQDSSQSSAGDEELQVPSLNDFQQTDFGGIEELWDWDALNIDQEDLGDEINFIGFGGSTSG